MYNSCMELSLMLIKALPALILLFYIWPMTIGIGIGLKKNLDRYLIGFAVVQALFFLIYIPAILCSWSSKTLTYASAMIITLLGVVGTVTRYTKVKDRKEFLSLKKPNYKFLKNPFFVSALIIIVYETLNQVVREPYIYGDDVVYIRMVTDYVDTNSIYSKIWAGQENGYPLSTINFKYVFSSYYPFLGMISMITRLHPLVLCKTVLPLIYVPIHYLIIWRIGEFLFEKTEDSVMRLEKHSMFLFLYSILIEFGQISYYTLSRRVTIWVYNSKSDCFVLLLPILFFYAYYYLIDKDDLKIGYRQFMVAILALACNSASTMGVFMSALTMGLWFVIVAYRQRKPAVFFSCLWTLIPHAVTMALICVFTGFLN